MENIEVDLGDVPFEDDDTDEMLMQRAKDHLPTALRKLGEKVGERKWEMMQEAFGSNPMFSMSGTRESTMQEEGENFVQSAEQSTRDSLVQNLFEQLKEKRDSKKG